MKKITKTIAHAAVIVALFASLQISAMAAVEPAGSLSAPPNTVNSVQSQVAESVSPNTESSDILRAETSAPEIAPINQANPDTGVQNMVIPGVVALIAAATAAIALSGKK